MPGLLIAWVEFRFHSVDVGFHGSTSMLNLELAKIGVDSTCCTSCTPIVTFVFDVFSYVLAKDRMRGRVSNVPRNWKRVSREI